MSALSNVWTIITSLARPDDDTIRLGLTDIGFGLVGGEFFEVQGVEGTTLYKGKKFPVTRVSDDLVDIDFAGFSLTSPVITGTIKGMVRVYQAPVSCEGAMRISFNPHNITAITSTGDTGEFGIDNVLSSNRGITHTLDDSDHQVVPTVKVGSLITSVVLVDFRATKADGSIDTDVKIRVRGGGDSPIDVVFPAVADRYLAGEMPVDGFPGMVDGHNINDPVPHAIFYIPPIVADGTEKIDIIDANTGTTLEFSELLLCTYWQPGVSKNFSFGSQTKGSIKATDTWRGTSLHRQRDGLSRSRSATLEMMDENDCTHAYLFSVSGGTMVCDSYPNGTGKRWRTIVVGFPVGEIDIDELRPGGQWPINVIDTKLIEDI